MKYQFLVLPAVVSAFPWAWPQIGKGGGSGGKLAFVNRRTEKPTVQNAGALRTVTRFGPLTLKPATGGNKDSGQQNWFGTLQTGANGLPSGVTVLKGHITLENQAGTQLSAKDGVYIHHILTYDTTKKSKNFLNSCSAGGGLGGGMMGSKFVGSGEDNNNVDVWYTTRDGTHQGGFHIGNNDRFMAQVDLVSYAKQPVQVYMAVDLEYLKGQVGPDTRETLLSVTGCGVPTIKISNTGPTNTTSAKYTFTEDGAILGAKGHLHAGGDKMVMYINGKFACESKAIYGGQKGAEAIDEMSLCTTKPIQVKKGDVLTMIAAYDVSKHPVRHESHGMGAGMPDIMGMWDLIFAGTR